MANKSLYLYSLFILYTRFNMSSDSANDSTRPDPSTANMDLKEQIDQLQQQLDSEIIRANSANARLQTQIDQFRQQLEHEKTTANSMQTRLHELTSEHTGQQNQIQELQQQLERANSAQTRLQSEQTSQQTQIQELQQQLEREKIRAKSAEDRNEQLASDNTNLQTDIKQLNQQVQNEKTRADSEKTHLQTQVDQFQQQLENLNLSNSNQASRITGLANAVQFQVAGLVSSAEVTPHTVQEIVDLVANPQTVVNTGMLELEMPTLLFIQESGRVGPAPYLFWIASRYGSATEVLDKGQAIFNNRQIAPEHMAQLRWIEDALLQLPGRFLQTVTIEGNKVAMLMLQVTFYLQGLIPSYSPDPIMEITGRYMDRLEDGFILNSMRSSRLAVSSWLTILDAAQGTHLLDHTNSALDESLRLVADGSGVFMLIQTIEGDVVAYVFDKDDIESVDVKFMGEMTLRMSSSMSIPSVLQSLLLTSDFLKASGAVWTFFKPMQKYRRA